MARKALQDAAKLLGGLGAAYLASGSFRPGVKPEDVNAEDAARDALEREQRYARTRVLKKGGSVSSASKRADGCAVRGKTRGKIV